MTEGGPARPSGNVRVRLAGSDDLARIERLWLGLYKQQKDSGMRLEVPADGYQKWATSLKGMLGRFACLFVAESGEEIAGFLAGRVRSLPPYFGGYPVGFVSEVFVEESYRGRGIGGELVTRAVSWFKDCGVNRIELQVIMNNESARRLYRRLGWEEELVQMIWQEEA